MEQQYFRAAAPPVIQWYKIYCIVMAVMYLFVVGAGIFLMLGGSFIADNDDDKMVFLIMGPLYLVLGIVFLIPFAIAPFLKPVPWVWIYGIVLICVGMTSCCCLPASIPLLIFWIKPDVKAYFGRTE